MVCKVPRLQLFQYLDGELGPAQQSVLECHLPVCPDCRRLVEFERTFRDLYLKPLRPDPVPEPVRDQVARLLETLPARQPAERPRTRPSRLSLRLGVLALVLVGGALGVTLPRLWNGPNTALIRLAEASVEQHQKLTRRLLPLDIAQGTPKAAEQWFRQRLDFNVSLPELSTREDLVFQGGRISHLEDFDVAALRYQLEGADVSLFIMPPERYRQLGLGDAPKFKMVTYQGYDVIVWTSHGAAYSLVSEIGGRSCLVCHSPAEKLDLQTGALIHGRM